MNDIDREFDEALGKIYELLEQGDSDGTILDVAYPYFPRRTADIFHYSLYQFEKAVHFSDELLDANRYYHGKSPNRFIERLIERAYKANKTETLKLLRWFKSIDMITHEKMHASESGLELLKLRRPRDNIRDHMAIAKQFLDAYKDKFEMKAFLILFTNLLLIPQGKKFSESPYKDYALTLGGERIYSRGFISTGMAIGWLKEQLSGRLLSVIKDAYDSRMRNIAGHNDYSLNIKKQTLVADNGHRLKSKDLIKTLNALTNLHIAVRINVSIRLFEYDEILGPNWNEFGLITWYYDEGRDALVVCQSLAMFDDTLTHKTIDYIAMKFGSGEAISLLFGRGLIFPYDMMVKIDEGIAKYLEIMSTKDKLKVIWLGVTPKYPPFSKLRLEEIELMGKKLLIAGYKEEVLKSNTESLKKILNGEGIIG